MAVTAACASRVIAYGAAQRAPPRGTPLPRTTTIPTPITRREGQPVPETLEEAQAVFRCQAYLIVMKGEGCARTHAIARETRAENRDACIACPAGAARARILGAVGPLKCAAMWRGKPCGATAEEGKLHCEAHRLGPAAITVSRPAGGPRGRPPGRTSGSAPG